MLLSWSYYFYHYYFNSWCVDVVVVLWKYRFYNSYCRRYHICHSSYHICCFCSFWGCANRRIANGSSSSSSRSSNISSTATTASSSSNALIVVAAVAAAVAGAVMAGTALLVRAYATTADTVAFAILCFDAVRWVKWNPEYYNLAKEWLGLGE